MLRSRPRVRSFGMVGGLLLGAACGAKEHPAAITDDTPLQRDASNVGYPMDDASADAKSEETDGASIDVGDARAPGDSGGNIGGGSDPLAVMLKEKCEFPPYEAFLCYFPEKGHPSESAIYRNMDTRNGVFFEWGPDPLHRTFKTRAVYQGREWWVTAVAPMGKELEVGSYSTDSNDGTALNFVWDTGQCPGKESATFDIYAITWDDKNIPARVELDFKHHCGEMSAPMAEARYRLHSSRPP